MIASIKAAENGAEVFLLEKMERVGKKMLITGKGRCNITNNADIPTIIKNIKGNGRFLNSSIYAFTNEDVIKFFNLNGVETKVERGGRVFPLSDKAVDAVNAMEKRMNELNVHLLFKTPVRHIIAHEATACGVVIENGDTIHADCVIIATGGASYPRTGSTGDGARMSQELGHHIRPLLPALVPLETEEDWSHTLQGLSLKNVNVKLLADKDKIAEEFGEMMFTHFGVTGPIILSLSRDAVLAIENKSFVELLINLKPALTPEKLRMRIDRDFKSNPAKSIKNVLHLLLPMRLIEPVLDLSYINDDKKVNQISKDERKRLCDVIQHLTLTVTSPRPIEEAIVTIGGVSTQEVNPKTMESKIIHNLYFAGEVMDIDGLTGGYNLQAAFSTGAAAGYYSSINSTI